MNQETFSTSSPVNIVTIKWGTRYSAEFANKLFAAVKRNLDLPFRFVCFTDDPKGLVEGIYSFPIPDIDLPKDRLTTGWRKLCLFKNDLPLEGKCLFLDLDLLIIGNLDDFFTYMPEKIPIIRDWVALGRKIFPKGAPVGNSSVFRFTANKNSFVYEQFLSEKQWALKTFAPPQSYLTHCIRPQMVFWPTKWCVSFKENLRPTFPLNYFFEAPKPKEARIVVFHGKPDPDEAAYGFKGKKIHHFVKPTSWVKELWEK